MKHFYELDLLENEVFGGELEEADEELPEALLFTLTLEDGREISCPAAGIFMENEKEYVALEMEGEEILIMALSEGEDDSICLLPVEDDAEREAAFQAFLEIIGTERGEEDDGDQDGEEN